ncbi:MAG: YbhB/YbcL family Raf kinase inhibitor-like protein [Phycisphaeraceae bacterium]
MAFTISSSAFADGQPIPEEYTREGKNVSPPLQWADVPTGTVQLALIVDDPDAPQAQPFIHWLIFAIPAEVEGLEAGRPREPRLEDPPGAFQGTNDFGDLGYDGPAPPPGSGDHHYRFELFALDRAIDAEPGVDHKTLRDRMVEAVIGRAILTGTYRTSEQRV